MGLDTTHDCWHGPYSAFNDWRREIAKAAGMPPLDSMVGFGGSIAWSSVDIPAELAALLNHSDCDGSIDASICSAMADRLEELIFKLPEDWAFGGHRSSTVHFIKGLRAAAAAGENVEFH